ncbi:hypothetical protein IWQ62_003884 [Dispira parvispora]|uniref:Mitochondrial carrier protein n=1 Tax=Dispira parvispora TaxID=1520584 RepID=A0A9W8ANI7_9FUNG|nr:hypothetical protein IWQ62_003884 [Dispira parvispora]
MTVDTVKTRIQAEPTLFRGSWLSSVQTIWRQGSLRTFYQGLPVALTFSIPALTTYLVTYDALKVRLDQLVQQWYQGEHRSQSDSPIIQWAFASLAQDSVVNYGLAATGAEMLSGLIWTPMEVLKNRLQVQGEPLQRATSSLSTSHPTSNTSNAHVSSLRSTSLSSTWQLARQISHNEGIRGFFRGYWLSLAVFVPHTVIYFITYEKLKQKWALAITDRSNQFRDSLGTLENMSPRASSRGVELPFYGYLGCAATACALSASVSNVFDVIKTRWQVQQSKPVTIRLQDRVTTFDGRSNISSPTIRQLVLSMWRTDGGYQAFTRGMLARVLWMLPSVTISMTVYELLKPRGVGEPLD